MITVTFACCGLSLAQGARPWQVGKSLLLIGWSFGQKMGMATSINWWTGETQQMQGSWQKHHLEPVKPLMAKPSTFLRSWLGDPPFGPRSFWSGNCYPCWTRGHALWGNSHKELFANGGASVPMHCQRTDPPSSHVFSGLSRSIQPSKGRVLKETVHPVLLSSTEVQGNKVSWLGF